MIETLGAAIEASVEELGSGGGKSSLDFDSSKAMDFSNDSEVSNFSTEKDGNKESEGQIKENSISEQGKLDTSVPHDFSMPESSRDTNSPSNTLTDVDVHSETDDASDGYYSDYKTRMDQTPKDGERGHWEGERGESKYVPSDQTDAGKDAKDKLEEKGMDGIEYKDAEPDFSECAEATVEIDNMTEHRYDYYDAKGNYTSGNFSQADAKCAEKWNESQRDGRTDWKAEDVRDWRRENNYSWHERCDTRTMDLVSYDIHSFFGHYGGCAECRGRDAADIGGGFDE